MKAVYTEAFYAETQDSVLASARIIVPLILDLVAPKSIIDVGCGRGAWLKTFAEGGVHDILGIDGPWVKAEDLLITEKAFIVRDLVRKFTVGRSADLVMSLEVAEHLDSSAADSFVTALTDTAPVVLFSAAIPFQGGTDHVNEQWPAYWEEKFRAHGYVPVDAIRRHIWKNESVAFFYAQNMLLYVKESELLRFPKLTKEIESGFGSALSLVHPKVHLYVSANSERWKLIEPYINKLPLPLLRKLKGLLRNFGRA